MTAILKDEPPGMAGTDAAIPLALERTVHHCLEKNPEERFQSARDLAFDLTSIGGVSGISRGVAAPRRRALSPGVVAAVVAALAAGLLLGAGLMARLRKPVEARPIRVRALTFSGR